MDFKGKEVFKGENMAEIAQKSKELSSSIKSVSNAAFSAAFFVK